MGQLSVREWRRFGHDRLYLDDTDGEQNIGYYDRKSGALQLSDEARRHEALVALSSYLPRPGLRTGASDATAAGTGPGHPERSSSDMRAGLAAAAMAAVAETAASATSLAPASTVAAEATPGADLPDDVDFAANAAGSAAGAKAAEESSHWALELAARLFGVRTESTSWRVGAAGERMVGRKLEHLESRGWRVLHAIPLPSGADIDHLVIGPAGVFTINTKHHANAKIAIGTYVVWVNGTQYPYLRNSLREARTAERRLSSAVGFSVGVAPVLAFVRAGSLTVRSDPPDVVITSGETVHRTLRRFPTQLDPGIQEEIYAAARLPRTWLG